jgi:5-methylthioadenosine/S-adenosylhomocysteine deaminase
VDLAIRNGTVIDPEFGLRQLDVLIRGGRIAQLGGELTAHGARVLDATGKLIAPGLISAHTHVTTTADRGLMPELPMESWSNYIFRAGVRPGARETYALAALGAAELLLNGCTALLDHAYINPLQMVEEAGAVAQACADTGIRAVIAPLFTDMAFSETLPARLVHQLGSADALNPGPPLATEFLLEQARSCLKQIQGRHALVTMALGPSGPQRCTDELLQKTAELAREFQVPLHTHVCESKAQAIAGYGRYGHSIITHLERLGFLGARCSLAHAIWIDDEDIATLARTRTAVVHNPLSNMKLGNGIAPIQRLRDAGVQIALGADGPGSGDSLNMFEIVKLTALLHKLYGRQGDWVSARQALQFCFSGGAAVLDQNIGRIAEGAQADLVLLDGEPFFRIPEAEYMLRQLVYTESARAVRTVVVGGRIVVENGRLTTINLDEIRRECQQFVDRLGADLPQRRRAHEEARPFLESLQARVAEEPLPFDRWISNLQPPR